MRRRRPILHTLVVSAVGFMTAMSLAACAQKDAPTDPLAAGAPDHALITLPPRPPRPDPEAFADITAGNQFTCARKNNGKVYCWGLTTFGQTGTTGSKGCVSYQCEDHPVLVMNGADTLRAQTLDAGTGHVCIIDSLQDAWCWGDGSQGQLGFNSGVGGANPPTKVANLKFTSLGAGSNSTCGIATTGVFCWGRIENGANSPVMKTSDPSLLAGMIVGDLHACFLEVSWAGRALDCWGNNTYGQVGIDPNQYQIWNAPFALRAQFGQGVTRAATEFNITCVDQSNGTVQCAGENTYGALGNGVYGVGYSTGVPQTVGGGMQLHGVTTGQVHACALDATNHAWCWGNGLNGQVGAGTGTALLYNPTPRAVAGGLTFRSLAAGAQHTCGIGTDNHLYCWGLNSYGQLGQGYAANSYVASPRMALDPTS